MAQRITRTLLLIEGETFEKRKNHSKSRSRKKGPKMKYCNKIRYRYHSTAVEALTKAKHQRVQAQADGVLTLRTEKRIYWHDQCNSYHLTSQSPRSEEVLVHAA